MRNFLSAIPELARALPRAVAASLHAFIARRRAVRAARGMTLADPAAVVSRGQMTLDQRIAADVDLSVGAMRARERAKNRAAQKALIKDRPLTLEQRYELIERDDLSDAVFERLKRAVFQDIDQSARRGANRVVAREAGRMAPGRAYFFLKPAGDAGFLFERAGAGWVVSRAEKIVARDLFLRRGAVIDSAALYLAKDGAAFPRVKSALFGDDLTPFAVYEQKLLERLGL